MEYKETQEALRCLSTLFPELLLQYLCVKSVYFGVLDPPLKNKGKPANMVSAHVSSAEGDPQE